MPYSVQTFAAMQRNEVTYSIITTPERFSMDINHFEIYRTPLGSYAFIVPRDKFEAVSQALLRIPIGFSYSFLSSEEVVIYLPTNIDEATLAKVKEILANLLGN